MLLNNIYKLIVILNEKEIKNNIEIDKTLYESIYTILTIPLKNDDYNDMINDINKYLNTLKLKLMKKKEDEFLFIITYIYKIDHTKIETFIKDIKENITIDI